MRACQCACVRACVRVGAGHVSSVFTALTALLLGIPALMNDPVVPTVLAGALLLNAFSILCEVGQPILRNWAMAYVAMGLQGTAHSVSKQPATLLKLQVDESGDRKTRFEWSHVSHSNKHALALHVHTRSENGHMRTQHTTHRSLSFRIYSTTRSTKQLLEAGHMPPPRTTELEVQ